jgi:hypothetical protein
MAENRRARGLASRGALVRSVQMGGTPIASLPGWSLGSASGHFRQEVPESPLIPARRRTTAQIGRSVDEQKTPANHAFARGESDLRIPFVVQAVAGSNPVSHLREMSGWMGRSIAQDAGLIPMRSS